MNKKVYTWTIILILILLSNSIVSAKQIPITPAVSTGGLQIAYTEQFFYPLNRNFTLFVHVYNSTSSMMTEPSTNCNIHLYNNSGEHLVNSKMEYEASEIEYKFIVDSKLIDNVGIYSYIVTCNGTEEGFLSTYFRVTTDGYELPDDYYLFTFIMLLPMIFGIICIAGIFSLDNDKNDSLAPIKILLLLLALFSIVISLMIGITLLDYYFNNPNFSDILSTIVIVITILLTLIAFYMGFIHIKYIYFKRKAEKEKEMEY